MNYLGKTTIHPALFYSGKILGYLCWMVYLFMIIKINLIDAFSFDYIDYISFIIFLVGFTLIVLSLKNLGNSTRIGIPAEKTNLKTFGIYKFSRNPMYVGIHLWTISSIIYTQNWFILIIGIYSIIIYHFIVLGEERFLENRFGEEYSEYRKKVRKYF